MVDHVDVGNSESEGIVEDLERTIDEIESGNTVTSNGVVESVEIPLDEQESSDTRITSEASNDDMSTIAENNRESSESDGENAGSTAISYIFPENTSTKSAYKNETLVSAHQEVQQTMKEFLSKKRKFGLITLTDRPEVATVKSAIIDLNKLLYKDVPLKDGDYAFELQSICMSYENLMKCCREFTSFINSKTEPSKKESKMRELAQEMIPQCEKELGQFNLIKGMYIAGERPAGESWTDILYSLRSRKVDEKKLPKIGAGTSELYISANDDGSQDFIKPEETLAASSNALDLITLYGKLGDSKEKEFVQAMLNSKDREGYEYYADKKMDLWKLNLEKFDSEEALLTNIMGDIEKLPPQVMEIFGNVENIKKFVKFCAKKRQEFFTGNEAAEIMPQTTISDRNVSTSRAAARLGISDIVAKSETILLTRSDGSTIRANSMEGVVGKNVIEMAKIIEGIKKLDAKKKPNLVDFYQKKLVFSGNAVKQLFELQILDLISGQVDRHTNNYMAYYRIDKTKNEILVDSIKGIDNDMSFGEMRGNSVKKIVENMSPIADTDGKISIPCISRDFYDKLMTPGIEDAMQLDQLDLRSFGEIKALVDRFITVRNQIRELHENGSLLVIEDQEEWEKQYKERMISLNSEGTLARSYLSRVLQELNEKRLGNFLA